MRKDGNVTILGLEKEIERGVVESIVNDFNAALAPLEKRLTQVTLLKSSINQFHEKHRLNINRNLEIVSSKESLYYDYLPHINILASDRISIVQRRLTNKAIDDSIEEFLTGVSAEDAEERINLFQRIARKFGGKVDGGGGNDK